MKIILLNPWNESWRNDDGYLPYNAIVDGDKDILIAVNDEHEMKYSHLFLGEHGTTLKYLPVAEEDAASAWQAYVQKHEGVTTK